MRFRQYFQANESSLRDILGSVPQSPKHHAEGGKKDAQGNIVQPGTVWDHTKLVRKGLEIAIDLLRDASANPNSAFSELNMNLDPEEIKMLRSGAWMHDIGKGYSPGTPTATAIGKPHAGGERYQGQEVPPEKWNDITAYSHEEPKYYEPLMKKLGHPWQGMYNKTPQNTRDDLAFMIRHHMSLKKNDQGLRRFGDKTINKLIDPSTGKYLNQRNVKLLLILMLMDKMGRYGIGERQFGLANGLQAIRDMEASAKEYKEKNDQKLAAQKSQKAQYNNPEEMRQFLMQKVNNGQMTVDQVEKAVASRFGGQK